MATVSQPLFATHAPGDRDRLFIVQRFGNISILDLNTGVVAEAPFLSIPETETFGEGGLLGLAFHPDYASNGKFYVYVTVDNGGVLIDGVESPYSCVIREYTTSADPNVANASYTTVWESVRPGAAHNAGWIGFSPLDNYLYVMSGDGGNGFDFGAGHTPGIGNAQDLTDNLFGKALRLDVNGDDFPNDPNRNYAIPPTNPFVGIEGDDEIWAYGLRNPYRASFDRATGDLWIGDVGQAAREEVNFQLASSAGGENYGWRLREGSLETDVEGIGGERPPGNVDPVYDYAHGIGAFEGLAVVGGYVYRGPDPELQGMYIFGDTGSSADWESYRIWGLDPTEIPNDPGDPPLTVTDLKPTLRPDVGLTYIPVSFGEDAVGNLYITFLFSDEVYRLVTDTFISGDFDGDVDVDDDDLAKWNDGFGIASNATNGNGDADLDGDVDGHDFLAWQRNYGHSFLNANSEGAVSVPEPSRAGFMLTTSAIVIFVRRRFRLC